MSLKSWLDIYYPESAAATVVANDLAAVEHSLRKWDGLTPSVLADHTLVRIDRELVDNGNNRRLSIDSDTCALCKRHLFARRCADCPLAVVRGGTPCDEDNKSNLSPYALWIENGDPGPMIAALKKAREFVKQKEQA